MEYKDLVQELANDLITVVSILDIMIQKYSVEDLKTISGNMHDHNSHLAAWPFPETMRKAEVMKAQTDTLDAFIHLLEIRRLQIEVQSKPIETTGEMVLKQMGF